MGRRKKKKKINWKTRLFLTVLIIVFGWYYGSDILDLSNKISINGNGISFNTETVQTSIATVGSSETVDLDNDKLNILFFYVGQADCTLIKIEDNVMLIDAGNNQDGSLIANFLIENNITQIDYLIATHADEDHIGGIDTIIESVEVEKMLIPTVGSSRNRL